jgi:hypothetical protein
LQLPQVAVKVTVVGDLAFANQPDQLVRELIRQELIIRQGPSLHKLRLLVLAGPLSDTYDGTMRHAKRLRSFGPAERSLIESEMKPVIITADIITPRRLQQYHRTAQ